MLDQKLGSAQGNLNPKIYGLAASNPEVFHDATVATSGVATCDVNAASTCNNSIPAPTSTAATTPGYTLATGFDPVTGLGSLDVAAFLNDAAISPKITPTVIVSPSSASIDTLHALTVGVTVSAGIGNPTPTGTVTLTGGSYTSPSITLTSGSASIGIAAGALSTGPDLLTVLYTPDSASSTSYNTATGTTTVNVSIALIGFTVSSPTISVTAGATTNNTFPITVAPTNGFTGTVTLAASITSSPTGAVNIPTISFGSTSPVNITSANPATANLTVTTVASQPGPCTAGNVTPRGLCWQVRGGGVLACVLLFGIRSRRRRFRAALGMLALLVALAGGVVACGGSKAAICTPTTIAGTTAGTYTITVTGTSATAMASRTVTLTVQ